MVMVKAKLTPEEPYKERPGVFWCPSPNIHVYARSRMYGYRLLRVLPLYTRHLTPDTASMDDVRDMVLDETWSS